MCAEKFPLVSMGGRAEGLACADPGARTPIGTSRILVRVALCRRCLTAVGHYFAYFGPSGVRALPLAAGINEGGHYFGPSVLRAPAEQTKVATIFGN